MTFLFNSKSKTASKLILLLLLILLIGNVFATAYWQTTLNCNDNNPATYDVKINSGCSNFSIDANTYLGNVNGTNLRTTNGAGISTTDNTYIDDGNIIANFTYFLTGDILTVTNTSTGLIAVDKNAWRAVPPYSNDDGFVSPYETRYSGSNNFSTVTVTNNVDYNVCLIASNSTNKKYNEKCQSIHIPFAPTTTSDANSVWNTRPTVTFTCTPDTEQTCRDLNYSINSGTWINTNYSFITAGTDITQTSKNAWDYAQNPDWVAQTFKPNQSLLSLVTLHLDKHQSFSPFSCNITINTTSLGLPTNTILATQTFSSNTITQELDYNFSLPTNLTIGQTYAIVLSCPTGDSFDYIKVAVNNSTAYADGNYYTSSNSGGTWNNSSLNSGDFYFKTWYSTGIIPIPIIVPDGNNFLQFYSTDNNGNVETTKIAYHALDTVNPSSSISGCTSGWHTTNQTPSITATDATSGIKTIFLWDSNGTYTTSTSSPLNYLISTDGNHVLTYHSQDNALNSDANKTSYCAIDTTAPTTTFSGATGAWQGTTLSITLTCADTSGSGCANTHYRINSSGAYTTYSGAFGVSDGNNKIDYYSTDAVGNSETPKTNYAAQDTIPPTTILTQTSYADTNIVGIHLACVDAGSGCATTKYRIAGGAWQTFTVDFNYVGLGSHTIDYNSTDNIGNVETMHSTTLNSPVLLTIKYPKNIATLQQITEKWTLRSTGGVIINVTNLTTDYNTYVSPNILTTFYIQDVNGNYTQNIYTRTYYADSNTGYDTLQPYLYAINTSLPTTFNILNKNTLAPLKGYTMKVYGNLPGIGNTLIGQGTSDSKGQILQLFIAGQAYVLEIYDTNNILLGTFNYTAINNQAYIYYNFLSIYIASLPPVNPPSNSDMNTITTDFFGLRNTLFSTCTSQDACFPSALIAILLTIVCLITATGVTSATGSFIGIKGLSIIAFCCFTIFMGIGFLPLFIYAFLGTITLLMAVLTQ